MNELKIALDSMCHDGIIFGLGREAFVGLDDGIIGEEEFSWSDINVLQVSMHLGVVSDFVGECNQSLFDRLLECFNGKVPIFQSIFSVGDLDSIEGDFL